MKKYYEQFPKLFIKYGILPVKPYMYKTGGNLFEILFGRNASEYYYKLAMNRIHGHMKKHPTTKKQRMLKREKRKNELGY